MSAEDCLRIGSDARVTYFDPFSSRDNLHVITGQQVTRILFDKIPANRGSGPILWGNDDSDGSTRHHVDRSKDPKDDELPNLRITGVEVAHI